MIECPICLSLDISTQNDPLIRTCDACGHAWCLGATPRWRPFPGIDDVGWRASVASAFFVSAQDAALRRDMVPAGTAAVAVPWWLAWSDVPRTFLRTLRRQLPVGGRIVLAVPVDDAGGDAWLGRGQRRRFSTRQLTRLVDGCRFRQVCRWSVDADDAMLAVVVAERPAEPSPVAVADSYLQRLADGRRRGGAWALEAAAAGRTPGLWGVGSDLEALLTEEPRLLTLLDAGKAVLFDAGRAGEAAYGAPIREPASIPAFDGPVFVLPCTRSVREAMLSYARRLACPDGRVVDPYGAS